MKSDASFLWFLMPIIVAIGQCGVESPTSAGETKIVAPTGSGPIPGDTRGGTPKEPIRVQFLYDSSNFGDLPDGSLVGAIAWRLDEESVPVEAVGDLKMTLSTTERDQLSLTFSENVGDDALMVFDGEMIAESNPQIIPAPFDLVVDFDRPFAYHASQGNLLIDVFAQFEFGDWWLDSVSFGEDDSFIVQTFPGSDPLQPDADGAFGALHVLEFTFLDKIPGDYNLDGQLDAEDLVLQANAIEDPNVDLALFDENLDQAVNYEDRLVWVRDHFGTWVGDSNLDGEFNSADLVTTFAAGKYEADEDAVWTEGDWTGDHRFDSSDLVAAFTDGGYAQRPRPSINAVPEPASFVLLTAAMLGIAIRRRSVGA